MIDKIVIVNIYRALIIFTHRSPVTLQSDRDIRELLFWFLDIHMRLVNDDITEKILVEHLKKVS